MNDPVRYGQMRSERMAEENELCRQMLREINNFGISERQRLMLIYLLAQELENIEQMKAVTKLVRELGGDELFLIGNPEGDDDGSSSV